MTYLIGADEAGYGPNLGPLVIAATVWRIDDPSQIDDLYSCLRKSVCLDPPPPRSRKIAIADSKRLYRAGQGLADLERGVLAALACCGRRPADWRDLWSSLAGSTDSQLDAIHWHDGHHEAIPLALSSSQINRAAELLDHGLQAANVALHSLRARAIFPLEFNELTDRFGNKGEVLSRLTLELIAKTLAQLPDGPVRVLCDKHGGRNRYQPLIQCQFEEWLVEVLTEGNSESRYRFGSVGRPVEIRFSVGGERHLPVALASMTAKYLREVAMRPFNAFWRRHLPALVPTAGYPQDARRFLNDIAPVQRMLGMPDQVLWRCR